MSDNDSLAQPNGTAAEQHGIKKSQTVPVRSSARRTSSYDGLLSPLPPLSPISPSLSLRDVQADSSSSQFPLTNIDNPNDIAQELSNLQALRRMSMDVGSKSDPDLPFQGMSLMAMPSIAPTGEDDEGDISRLLWVPAKVHPELAPDQFKNFLENRVQSMKRRSGESMLSIEGLQRNNSASLRRGKSMLSRQIDNAGGSAADGYVDGADRLIGRRRSQTGQGAPELSLNELVKDPTRVVQQLAQESQAESSMDDDMPILPVAPGMGLRRSTRTTYRKGGSVRSGDRLPFSKRVAARQAEKEGNESPRPPKSSELEPPKGHSLQRVQSEPVAENYSRPTRAVRRQQPFQISSPVEGAASGPADTTTPTSSPSLSQQAPFRNPSTSVEPAPSSPIPAIVATAPPEESSLAPQPPRPYPQRSSSQKAASQMLPQAAVPEFHSEPPPRSSKRPSLGRPIHTSPPGSPANNTTDASSQSPSQQLSQTLNDMASHPPPLPGSGSTRTDSLTFIPTLPAEDKKADKKSREREDAEGGRSTGWKWFKSDDKEKRKKEREKEEQGRKARAKAAGEKPQEKGHDNARLDVIQSSIDNALAKGRESLLLDRESIDNKLHEERKKESSRRSGDSKKEKDGFFGSFFGGSKRKESKEGGGKGKQRALSPEPPVRLLRPDIDYPYTRFPIVEERAIYRMAHIKLANPRRELRSQVLLSNFMYSYLAKVQAMHPQLNVAVSPQQKRQEEERKRRDQDQQQQQYLEQQMQQSGGQDNSDQYGFEYHRVCLSPSFLTTTAC